MVSKAEADELYAVIEGPSLEDASFYGEWLLAAAKAEALWKLSYADPEFDKQVASLCVVYVPDFAIAAAILLADLLNGRGVSLVRLDSEQGDEFTMLVGMGFFVLTGDRYQTTMPDDLNIERVKSAVLAYAETEERYAMHPERLVASMPLFEAQKWEVRLRDIGESQRVADRGLLLENVTTS